MSIAIAVIFAFVSGSVRGAAVDSASGFDIWVTVEELTGQESGYASVKLTLDIPAGTPLLARESAIDSAMAALRDIWNVRSFHQDVRGFLGSEIPYDIQQSVSTISGTSFILAITDAFNAVEDAGYSRFQCDVSISIAEKITLPYPSTTPTARTPYPDAPRNFQWIVSGPSAMNPRNSETWVIASLVNFSASVLSFRSEFGRFPSSLAELDERGHLLIEPINPYTNIPVQQANTAVPGDINYEYIDANTVSLITYIVVNGQLDVVIATFTINDERREQWNFSDAYYQDEVGLLVKKDAGFESLADLDGKRIGVAQGATTADAVQAEADELGIDVEFLEFATYPEINAALESGRVDAFSVDKSILSGYVTDDSTILPDGFSPQDYGVASKLGTDGLTEFINDMLVDMEASGELDTLFEKWGLL